MKYTPGPWIAIRQKGKQHDGSYCIGRKDDHGKGPMLTFASVLGPNDLVPPEYGDVAEANANLIAAAPDLLEALEAVIENGIDMHTSRKAHDAIAKAKGDV